MISLLIFGFIIMLTTYRYSSIKTILCSHVCITIYKQVKFGLYLYWKNLTRALHFHSSSSGLIKRKQWRDSESWWRCISPRPVQGSDSPLKQHQCCCRPDGVILLHKPSFSFFLWRLLHSSSRSCEMCWSLILPRTISVVLWCRNHWWIILRHEKKLEPLTNLCSIRLILIMSIIREQTEHLNSSALIHTELYRFQAIVVHVSGRFLVSDLYSTGSIVKCGTQHATVSH